jgi:hypothetical protein
MSTYAKLYWLTRLDSISIFFEIIAFILFIGIVVLSVYYALEEGYEDNLEMKKKSIKIGRILIISFLFSLLLNVFIPSQKEATFIIAGGKIIDFIKSDKNANKIPAQTTAITSSFLQKQIDKMNNDSTKNK